MASLNKAVIIGNLGKEPEVRYMPNGDAIANFSVATTEKWKGQDGKMVEKTEWHNIVMYKKLAEIAGQYLKKGSQVYLEGRIQTRKWQDKQTGTDRYTTEIIANEMKMLGSAGGGDSKPYQAQQQAPQRQQVNNGDDWETPQKRQAAPPTAAFDDEIPF